MPNIPQWNFQAALPNQNWLTSLKEFTLSSGKMYPPTVIGCFNGVLHSWMIRTSPNTQLVSNMLERALATLHPRSIRLFIRIGAAIADGPAGSREFSMQGSPGPCRGKDFCQAIQPVKGFSGEWRTRCSTVVRCKASPWRSLCNILSCIWFGTGIRE